MSEIAKFGTTGRINENDFVLIRAEQVAMIVPAPGGRDCGCTIALTTGEKVWVAVPADEAAGRLGFQIV